MAAKIAEPATFDPRVDEYIHKVAPFAQPILLHIRKLIHKAVPSVTETIKWSHAFFEYKTCILANMAGFKEHCSLGFWGQEMTAILRKHDLLREGAMGSLGRISSMEDLPQDKLMLSLFREAASLIDQGKYTSPMSTRKNTMVRAAKPKPTPPPDFAAALKTNKAAQRVFTSFSPSCQREYIDWINEAKRPETRERRLTQAIEMIAEGKERNWKYQTR